jgi:hypothetical protein
MNVPWSTIKTIEQERANLRRGIDSYWFRYGADGLVHCSRQAGNTGYYKIFYRIIIVRKLSAKKQKKRQKKKRYRKLNKKLKAQR